MSRTALEENESGSGVGMDGREGADISEKTKALGWSALGDGVRWFQLQASKEVCRQNTSLQCGSRHMGDVSSGIESTAGKLGSDNTQSSREATAGLVRH